MRQARVNPRPDDRSATPLGSPVRLRAAGWTLLRALEDYLAELSACRAAEHDWIDQTTSPLGRRAHLRAVREGRLPGVKRGKKVLVRAVDLREYLGQGAVQRRGAGAPERTERSFAPRDVAARTLAELGATGLRKTARCAAPCGP
jgi:hypothetical protein